jgi:uncharacterized integral membrane protein
MDSNAALALLLALLPIVLERRMKTASAIWHHVLTALCFLLALLIVLDMHSVQSLLAPMPKHVAAGLVALVFAVVGWGTYWLTGERELSGATATEKPPGTVAVPERPTEEARPHIGQSV